MPANKRTHDQYYGAVLDQAIQKGVYRLPPALFDPNAHPIRLAKPLIQKDSSYPFDERQCRYLVLADDALPPATGLTDGVFLLLRADRHTFVWPIDRSQTKLGQFLLTGRRNWAPALAIVYADMLPPGRYQVGISYFNQTQWVSAYSAQYLPIAPPTIAGLIRRSRPFAGTICVANQPGSLTPK